MARDPWLFRMIDGRECLQIAPSPALAKRAIRYTNPWGASERAKPGYWVKLTKLCYAYREHTGDVTVWRATSQEGKEGPQ